MMILTIIFGFGSLVLVGQVMKDEKLKRRLEEASNIQLDSAL